MRSYVLLVLNLSLFVVLMAIPGEKRDLRALVLGLQVFVLVLQVVDLVVMTRRLGRES